MAGSSSTTRTSVPRRVHRDDAPESVLRAEYSNRPSGQGSKDHLTSSTGQEVQGKIPRFLGACRGKRPAGGARIVIFQPVTGIVVPGMGVAFIVAPRGPRGLAMARIGGRQND